MFKIGWKWKLLHPFKQNQSGEIEKALFLNFHFLIDVLFFLREGRGNAHLTGNYKRIGDVVLHNFDSVTTEYYLRYVDTHGLLLEKLERVLCDPNRYIQLWSLFYKVQVNWKGRKNLKKYPLVLTLLRKCQNKWQVLWPSHNVFILP